MTMDLSQLSQMTSWLDEEHRRDKAELQRLQQTVQNQEAELQDQARVIQALEGRMAGLQAQLLRFSQLEAALEQLKEEVIQMITQADDRRQAEAREIERVRAIERDNVTRSINEVRRDLQRLPRLVEELGLRKAEQSRVSEALLSLQQTVGSLSQDVDNRLRGLSFLEDGRQQDSKRIARLQQESIEIMKRLEQISSRLQRLEDVSVRQERDTGELKSLVTQLRTAQREFIDGQLLEAEQVKRHLAESLELLDRQVKRIDEFAARLQEFSDAFREDRQVVAAIERFQEQIRRDQTQVAELQRLAEERQKRQLEQAHEESEKRWQKELMRWEHQWAEQAKRNQQIADLFAQMEAHLAQDRTQIEGLWRFLETQITYHTQESRRWLGEMNRLLEERPKRD